MLPICIAYAYQTDQKNSFRSSNIRPPQMMKASRPGKLSVCTNLQPRRLTGERLPIHSFEIGGFAFCFCLIMPSGFPRFAVSCLAYRSLAFRCWGVCAYAGLVTSTIYAQELTDYHDSFVRAEDRVKQKEDASGMIRFASRRCDLLLYQIG